MSAVFIKTGHGLPLLAGTVLLILSILLSIFGYRHALEGTGRKTALFLMAMRCIALFSASMILIHPVVEWPKGASGKSTVAILIDDSKSMATRDSVGGASRAEAARKLLFSEKDESIAAGLERNFEVSYFLFAGDILHVSRKRAESKEGAACGGRSLITNAIKSISQGDPRRRISGAVVFTDGRDTGREAVSFNVGFPVYFVGLGSKDVSGSFKDIEIKEIHAERRALLANRMEAMLEVKSTGFPPLSATLYLSRDGKRVLRKAVRIEPGLNNLKFAFVPKVAGHHEYEVALEGIEGERTYENNKRVFVLTVDARKLRLLYFEAHPRWKYKFLRQELLRDRNLSATFQLKTNPARILQQGSPPVGLRGGFPSDLRTLSAFDCIILGDLSPGDLTAQQWRLVVSYVNRVGGGLLFLGGPHSWAPGSISSTPLIEILPCSAGNGELKGKLFMEVAGEGKGHPILSGIEAAIKGRRRRLFALSNLFRLEGFRPGAQVLLTARSPGSKPFPLLAVQRVGAGRTMVFASDTDWKWIMEARREGGEKLFSNLWGQAIRWLSGKEENLRRSLKGAGLFVERSVLKAGERQRITVAGRGIEGAKGEAALGARKWPISFEKASRDLAASFFPEIPGRYRVTVEVSMKGGKKKELEATFMVEPDERELSELTINIPFMERIAEATGGKVLDAVSAYNLPEILEKEETGSRGFENFNPRSTPLLFIVIIVLLGMEWWIRRRIYGL